MKNFTSRFLALVFATSACMALNAQDNVITLKAAGTGSEGNTFYSDKSPISIDGEGVVTNSTDDAYDDWTVTGTVTLPNALNTTFNIDFGAFEVTNLDGTSFAEMIEQRGIDRAGTGQLGVRGGAGNGIDEMEGFYFGLDLADIPSTVSVRLTGIRFQYMGGGEIATVTSLLNKENTITASDANDDGEVKLPNGDGTVDISSFDLTVKGGTSTPHLVMAYNSGGIGNFRILGIRLEVIDNRTTGINDMGLNEFTIYPNPFNSVLTIEGKNSLSAELYNINGQLVKKEYKTAGSRLTLNASDLPSGIYFCKINNGTTTITKKVVKK
ncbi:Por secretion system C-terminal sorting domain-containing protein [Mariniphaga anaerophila]|uniref:Por secretion system C-terminal sorting domain-containing protein n=1 Tax=Mariniphaga anaerophila TaxID=1484053 RepID=A0A1M5CP27_9BACT|nr:T9SS type A sorting domain-containing protein [Mariniphaga anaerophila]SHF56416.1 Por secretion system C-terminal sorting domain-containing protein [Mariniphaga anaerophila]